MAKVNAKQWLDKWGRRLNAAGPDIKAGIQRVTEAPGVKAAAASDRMLAAITESIQSGHWANRVSSVSLGDWQAAMVDKGIPRLTQGVAGAQKNKERQITALLDNVDAAAAEAHALPKGGIEQSIARATAFMRAMSENSKKNRG